MNDTVRVTDPTEHIIRCLVCNGPCTAMFNRDSRVGWAECLAGGHHYVQSIFTPTVPGASYGYCLIGVDSLDGAS